MKKMKEWLTTVSVLAVSMFIFMTIATVVVDEATLAEAAAAGAITGGIFWSIFAPLGVLVALEDE